MGLITKDATNPFFVKTGQAAFAKAAELGVELRSYAGILVIALDTPPDPIDAADMTFATDSFHAGELIGSRAAKRMMPSSSPSMAAARG